MLCQWNSNQKYNILFIFSTSGLGKTCSNVLYKDVKPNWKQEILDSHNDLRGLIARGEEPMLMGLTASDMMEMRWDEELARGAQLWADQCLWRHDSNNVCRFRVGQNLYQTATFPFLPLDNRTAPDWREACQAWYSEVNLLKKVMYDELFSKMIIHDICRIRIQLLGSDTI